MANKYYCLVAGLPDILLGDKKVPYSSSVLLSDLQNELTGKDLQMAEALYYPFDNSNILNVIYKVDDAEAVFDERGVFEKAEIEQLTDKRSLDTLESGTFPNYMVDAANKLFNSEEELTKSQAEVIFTQEYYSYLRSFNNEFLNSYVDFDLNQRNIFTALNGRKYDIEFEGELIGDNDVCEALAKSRARDFGLSGELEYIEPMIQLFEDSNILDRELKIDQLKWDYLDDATFFNYFTIERVLSFIYKLFMVERWLLLSEEEGKKLFQKLLNELETSYEFPEEFILNNGSK